MKHSFKGTDNGPDMKDYEISMHSASRSVTPSKAAHGLLKILVREALLTVKRVALHLPSEQQLEHPGNNSGKH